MGLFLDGTIGTKGDARRRPPPVLGALSYEAVDGVVHSVGIAHQYVGNQGDAWSLVQRELQDYFARTPGQAASSPPAVGRFAELAETLGRRTGELHLALAKADGSDPAFAVEPLTSEDRVQAAARASAMLEEHSTALRTRLERLSAEARRSAETLLATDSRERRGLEALLARFGKESLEVVKTRIHGDLHLGQVLFHGDDFTIIDFEGEPARPLAERRAKSSPLRDVMGMVRSFSYAPEAVMRKDPDPTKREKLQAAAAHWQAEVRARYLRGYQTTVGNAPFLPPPTEPAKLELMLAFYELERVIYEVGYELNNRTDWVDIPLDGLRKLAAAVSGEKT
jgi:maltose alpha-D-glucosyltransferase/alpha-amylase